jgi:pyruvate dehydrogenase E2 component (dihydrolipoamide acetyltransferase)
MYEFRLPDVGEGIHEAEILKWLVEVGETVGLNQPMVEIQTDKAVVEIPAPVKGKVAEIRAKPGAVARVGDVIITIAPADGQPASQKAAANGQSGRQAAPPEQPTPAPERPTAGIAGPGQRVLAAPYVRKLARELGIDLAQVPGSGPAGRVLPEDVQHFAAQQPAAPPPEPAEVVEAPAPSTLTVTEPAQPAPTTKLQPVSQPEQEVSDEEPLQGLRRRIAERMELAWQIPHVTSFEEVDATHLVNLRQHLQPEAERRGVRLTYLPFIIKATIQALKEFPYFNASLEMAQQKIRLHRYYHIGIATAVPEGLLVPVIRHADRLSLLQLAAELNRLAQLAQQRKLGVAELSGSTFTITNFGSFGSHQGTPIINPPEVAILGCGRIEEKAVAVAGQVAVRHILPLALSFDHRLIDGAAAGQFLGRLKALLADPNLLFLELV